MVGGEQRCMFAVNHDALLIHGLSNARRNRARIDCWFRRAILSITSARSTSVVRVVNCRCKYSNWQPRAVG